MEELSEILSEMLSDKLYQIIISNSRQKDGPSKIKIRPVLLKGVLVFQESVSKGKQIFHENYQKEAVIDKIKDYMENSFKQLEAESTELTVTALVSKKGRITIKRQRRLNTGGEKNLNLAHNRVKKYILEEGIPVPFLIELGVQCKDGRVIRAKYDKFKQINRYLEFVEDILPTLLKAECIHIIDFGCGKSYLTFALYYYLHVLKKLDVAITGLDLKEDVIDHCNALAHKFGYTCLHFIKGDIKTFGGEDSVDMVVTLHACDTATDYALQKAVEWGARVIFSVPCCQHEVNRQIKNELLEPVLKYGLIKERLSALVTDAVRANLLEKMGYETQILEFIDMEHTPKNILIRAVKKSGACAADALPEAEIQKVTDFLQINTTLQKLLEQS